MHYVVQLIESLRVISLWSISIIQRFQDVVNFWDRRLGVIKNANEFWVSSQFVNV